MIALLFGANGDKRQTPLNGIVSMKGCRDDKPNLIGGASTSTMGLYMLWTPPRFGGMEPEVHFALKMSSIKMNGKPFIHFAIFGKSSMYPIRVLWVGCVLQCSGS